MRWLARWLERRPPAAESRHRPAFQPRVEALEERQVPTVNYYGGNLLPHVEAQPVFYGSGWSANPAQQATLNTFVSDLVSGPYMSALTTAGYGVGTGTATTGVVDNTTLATNSTITDASIQARIQADIKSGLVAAPDANRLYVVYVQPNVAVNLGAGQGTTQQGILGYHGAFGGTDAGGHALTIRYAVIAYPGGTVGNSGLGTSTIDQLTAVTSHETAEAATDPDVNYARLGWYDPRRGEIGDIEENNSNAFVRLADGDLVQEVATQNDQLLSLTTTIANPPPTQVATTTTLAAGPVTHYRGGMATVSLTVTVKPASGTAIPSGTVQLVYNGVVLGSGQIRVVNGVATVTFNLVIYQPGSYTFTVDYLGNSSFAGSTSNAVTVTD